MAKLALGYAATALVFVLMDFAWLSLAGPRVYGAIGPLLSDKVDGGAAIAFYVIYMAGLTYFAIRPALASGRWRTATLSGALFGLVAYATYDLTNQATLRLWATSITIADMGWGMTVSAVASTLGSFAASRLRASGT